MKRAITILKNVFFAAIALYPIGSAILSCFGCTLELFSVPAFANIVAALSICVVVLDCIYKSTPTNKAVSILIATITPLSIINTFMYFLESNHVAIYISGLVCFVCCCIITIKHAKPIAIKIIALVLSVLLAMPTAMLGLVALFPIGQTTVVKTVESPSGRYYAEVADVDQGALGADTVVWVYENWEINLLLFKIGKARQLVYSGEWREYETMKLHWKDDSCIVINSVEYKIK